MFIIFVLTLLAGLIWLTHAVWQKGSELPKESPDAKAVERGSKDAKGIVIFCWLIWILFVLGRFTEVLN
jgi:hypothetical protein